MKKVNWVPLFLLLSLASQVNAQDPDALELLEAKDIEVLSDDELKQSELNLSELEEVDDLQSLKSDIGDVLFKDKKAKAAAIEEEDMEDLDSNLVIKQPSLIINDEEDVKIKKTTQGKKTAAPIIFDVGGEEKKLLSLSKFVETKIPIQEWDEINTTSKIDKYVVQDGDWLWKISQSLFGSGFYYSKIWSLNPHITNPHEIEPGMTLVFTTGTSEEMPQVNVGKFETIKNDSITGLSTQGKSKQSKMLDFGEFGDNTEPKWLEERKRLKEQGVFFQYASEETYQDLTELGKISLRTEYQKYEPPIPDIVIQEPGEQYDDTGFDKDSKIVFNIKEGFFLNTFLSSNVVQDLGFIQHKKSESIFIQKFERVFVKLDEGVKVKPGDKLSVYGTGGKVTHSISDRSGYKYTIKGQLKVIRKNGRVWECEVENVSGIVKREDRITVYTPKINKIIKTFNRRSVEAAVIGAFSPTANGLSYGDVVYIDRGRADGVEMGNVFELFSFRDLGTGKRISSDPSYKIGEATVITLTDNFATVLLTQTSNKIQIGTLAIAKTEEAAARAAKLKNGSVLKNAQSMENKALEELDVELNLDTLSDDLLDKADRVQLTEDELEELERQEREKSIIKDHERDLRELERLESEIMDAEKSLNEAKVDEDKFLEQQNLDILESDAKKQDPNAFESVDDIEQELGVKYMDEDINAKENPYGLTEYDLEEIDELLDSRP
jgi:hypothetical protein